MYDSLLRVLHWYADHLTNEHLAWLHTLPDFIRWDGTCLAHDSPLDRLFPEKHFVPGFDAKYQELMYHAPGIYADTPAESLSPLLDWMAADGVSQVRGANRGCLYAGGAQHVLQILESLDLIHAGEFFGPLEIAIVYADKMGLFQSL